MEAPRSMSSRQVSRWPLWAAIYNGVTPSYMHKSTGIKPLSLEISQVVTSKPTFPPTRTTQSSQRFSGYEPWRKNSVLPLRLKICTLIPRRMFWTGMHAQNRCGFQLEIDRIQHFGFKADVQYQTFTYYFLSLPSFTSWPSTFNYSLVAFRWTINNYAAVHFLAVAYTNVSTEKYNLSWKEHFR